MSSSDNTGRPNDGERAPDDQQRRPQIRRVPNDNGDEYQSMDHLDPDQLTAFALDPDSDEERANEHLASCPRCRSELQTMRAVTSRARAAGRAEPVPVPPEHVWENVVRELTASGDMGPRTVRETVRWQPWALAAALVLLAVVAAGVLLPATGTDLVATATLEPLAQVARARAELVTDDDQRVLTIDDLELPVIDGYYELWLLTADGQRLISLGPVSDQARVDVPETIDTGQFSLVDISRELPDGDPSHSGDSVLRGPLEPRSEA